MGSNLMTHVPIFIDKTVVCGGLSEEVSGSDGTTIGIGESSIKQSLVVLRLCQGCEPIIKGQIDNLK